MSDRHITAEEATTMHFLNLTWEGIYEITYEHGGFIAAHGDGGTVESGDINRLKDKLRDDYAKRRCEGRA